MVDGSNYMALNEMKCNTSTTSTTDRTGDGCQEYIPSQEQVNDIINRDIESDFVELFVQLKAATRMNIGH